MFHVYIGWDRTQEAAWKVAADTLAKNSSKPVAVHKLDADDLYKKNLLWRPVEREGNRMIDHLSSAYQSTEFANSRFVIPYVHHTGWCLFTDCDVVFLGDVSELFALADDKYAVMCVKHQNHHHAGTKMDGQVQQLYNKKNWSSVCLWNVEHPAHTRMPLALLNQWPGELLHQFRWLRESEIGELPAEWNWLVNVTDKPENPKLCHFTLGGPFLHDWAGAEHDYIWNDAANQLDRYTRAPLNR